jgi:hypothetical protein
MAWRFGNKLQDLSMEVAKLRLLLDDEQKKNENVHKVAAQSISK